VHAIKRIFQLKEYNDEKAVKSATLNMKGYASPWYETLKKNRARKAKSNIKIWSKLKKYMGKVLTFLIQVRILPQDHLS